MTEPKIFERTLSSGLRVVLVPMPGMQSLTTLAMVGVGSRNEELQFGGISHFLEHLPFKGTENFPTSMDIAAAVDGVGGKHNAFTGKEYTGYWVKVGSKHWELSLKVVSDLLLRAKLRPEDIAKEKGVIIEEINMYQDQPQAKVGDLFDELVFDGTPLARPVIGTKDSVSKLEQEDFLVHWNNWYGPHNIVVGVVGGGEMLEQKQDELLTSIEKYFETSGAEKERVPEGLPLQTAPRFNVFYKDTEQAHFHLGFPAIGREDERRYVLAVLSTLMGGNSSSRMFNEVREKRGLAYYAYVSSDLYLKSGSLYALEGVSIAQAEEAVKVTIEEFRKALQPGNITEDEVRRAKEYVTGKLTLDLEDSADMADFMVRRALLDRKVEPVTAVLERIQAVKREDVVKLAEDLIDFRKANFAIIGPFKDAAKFTQLFT